MGEHTSKHAAACMPLCQLAAGLCSADTAGPTCQLADCPPSWPTCRASTSLICSSRSDGLYPAQAHTRARNTLWVNFAGNVNVGVLACGQTPFLLVVFTRCTESCRAAAAAHWTTVNAVGRVFAPPHLHTPWVRLARSPPRPAAGGPELQVLRP
jgi:hypothetical protein